MTDTVPPEAEARLTEERVVAHLATSVDDRPHVAPLWYRYDHGTLEVMTTGRKLANVRQNPRVAVSIERDTDGIPEWMVTLRGTATVVEAEEERREANRRINEKYDVETDAWSENTLVRIDIGSVNYREY